MIAGVDFAVHQSLEVSVAVTKQDTQLCLSVYHTVLPVTKGVQILT